MYKYMNLQAADSDEVAHNEPLNVILLTDMSLKIRLSSPKSGQLTNCS